MARRFAWSARSVLGGESGDGGFAGASGEVAIPDNSGAPPQAFVPIPCPVGVNRLFQVAFSIVVVNADSPAGFSVLDALLDCARMDDGTLVFLGRADSGAGGAIDIQNFTVAGDTLQVEIIAQTAFEAFGVWAYSISPAFAVPFPLL